MRFRDCILARTYWIHQSQKKTGRPDSSSHEQKCVCSLQEFPGPVTFRDFFCHAESHYVQKRVKNARENLS